MLRFKRARAEIGTPHERESMALEYCYEDADSDPYELEFRHGDMSLGGKPVEASFDHQDRKCVIATDLPIPREYRKLANLILDAGISIGRYRQRHESMIPVVS
jgi:hypothetical protein